jgi:hypothetical protein
VSRLIDALLATTSTLNFMLFLLMKSCAYVMATIIVGLANRSFSMGVFLSTLKHGHVTPLLKKSGLDKTVKANNRPITNLSTPSKPQERLVLSHLRPHLLSSGNFSEFK